MDCDEARRLMHGYLDKQLDAAAIRDIEAHLQGCADCARVYRAQDASMAAIRNRATYFSAPESLRARILSTLPADAERGTGSGRLHWIWLNFAAALAFAVIATWALTLNFAAPSDTERLVDEIVAAHVRSLMASHLADVASSDQHTVKPWFNGKLDFSPAVADLTADGFSLVGGRLDYLNHRPVAALAYRHRQHLINLFSWPASGAGERPPQAMSKQGYHLVHWTHAGMTFWAVSDLNPAELTQFKQMLIARGAE